MAQEIKMPSAGQTTDEARIVAVNVKPGDAVKRGDILVEAETDKAVLPVESFAAGTVLSIPVKIGDTVDAGSVLAVIGQPGERYDPPDAATGTAPHPAALAVTPAGANTTEIKMPSAGQTTDEAKIVSVHIKPGDAVKRGDILVEAETDKAVLPVESFAAGIVLEVRVHVGDLVTAGTALVVLEKTGRSSVHQSASAPTSTTSSQPTPPQEEYLPIIKGHTPAAAASAPVSSPASAALPVPAMPNAKLLANERSIDLRLVKPANGQFIKRQDVRNYQPAPEHTPLADTPSKVADYQVLPMSRMRKTIARRMTESVQQIPAFQCAIQVDMRQCMLLRDAFREEREWKLSYNDILAKAIAVAAKHFPLLNARYEQEELRLYHHTNVGLAVGLDQALVVPVARNLEEKGLEAISAEYKGLIKKARDNKLAPTDMGCGSITISNLGMYGIDHFTAIVNPPECGILAVGSIQTVPHWNGSEFEPVPIMQITGSFDHRIIDGAYGAQILQEIKKLMEKPWLMLG